MIIIISINFISRGLCMSIQVCCSQGFTQSPLLNNYIDYCHLISDLYNKLSESSDN